MTHDPVKTMEDAEGPVFGPGRFIGRSGLAQNLVRRCRRGQSIVLFGGPKLGKTSMLLHVQWFLQMHQSSAGLQPVYLDLRDPALRTEVVAGRSVDSSRILLLDHCDSLVNGTYGEEIRGVLEQGGGASATIWAGGRSWHEAVQAAGGAAALRRAPLAVLFPGEARQFVPAHLSGEQAEEFLALCGTHPYVLKVVAAGLQDCGSSVQAAVRAAVPRLRPFFAACRDAMRSEGEQVLMRYLAEVAKPVNPREAEAVLGRPSIKASADLLCAIGVISRWNLNEGAMLHAPCQLFNEWYLSI